MKPSKDYLLTAGFLLASVALSFAQHNKDPKKDSLKTEVAKSELYKKQPVWIAMQKDTAVVYNEAVRAFKEYWKERPEPNEEMEGTKKEKHNLYRRIFEADEIRKEKESEEYAFEYKKFKNWMRDNEPFVQPNGRLLTPNERIELWKQQRPQN